MWWGGWRIGGSEFDELSVPFHADFETAEAGAETETVRAAAGGEVEAFFYGELFAISLRFCLLLWFALPV